MLETAVKKATDPFGFDPMVILAIIEAIMAMFENCPERANLAQRLKNPGAVGRARLRRELRRVFQAEDCCAKHRSQVYQVAFALEGQVDAMSVADCESCVSEILG